MTNIEIIAAGFLYLFGFLIIYYTGLILYSIKGLKEDKDMSKTKNLEKIYVSSLGKLNLIYMSSPFIGLVGTLSAILVVFQDKTLFNSVNKEMMAEIISKLGSSLEYTLFGIIIAIPALIIYLNYKNKFNIIKNYEL
jgi:biopolymer transport protein ExbB/TolQ